METCQSPDCENQYSPKTKNQKYCRRTFFVSCEVCENEFTTTCSRTRQRTCGKTCSGKLIRKEQGERTPRTCVSCGVEFQARVTSAKYCKREVEVGCVHCGTAFSRRCEANASVFCSGSCKFLELRESGYSISGSRTCAYCSRRFTPSSSSQKYCGEDFTECQVCGIEFRVSPSVLASGRGLSCDGQCAALAQAGTKIPSERVREFKDYDGWAVRFRVEQGRLPTRLDSRLYFGVTTIPRSADLSLLENSYRSGLEIIVASELDLLGVSYVCNKRPLVLGRARLELDLWLQDLALAFEVQDFSSHSRSSESEVGPFGVKRGPEYHERKRLLAVQQLGVRVVDVWEDVVLDGSFRGLVRDEVGFSLDKMDRSKTLSKEHVV